MTVLGISKSNTIISTGSRRSLTRALDDETLFSRFHANDKDNIGSSSVTSAQAADNYRTQSKQHVFLTRSIHQSSIIMWLIDTSLLFFSMHLK